MAEKQTVEFAPIAQMSIKKMGCDAKDAIRVGKPVFMCRVFGEAADLKSKEARNGDTYSYLIGEFRAETAKGDKYESTKLFLPGGVLEQIEASLKASEGKPVQFAYDIFAAPDTDVTIGYRYAAKVLIKTDAADRLGELGKQLNQKAMPKTEEPDKKKKAGE